MENSSIKHILVELDCLLDTRLGTAHLLNKYSVKPIIESGKYHIRDNDNLSQLSGAKFSDEEFRIAYHERNVETLKASIPTNMLGFLHKVASLLSKDIIDSPEIDGIEVCVNTHPYKLDKDNLDDLVNIVGSYLHSTIKVSVVSFKMSELSPNTIKEKYEAVILYDFDFWYSENYMLLKECMMPRNIIYAPALYIKEKPSKDELAKLQQENLTPFNLLEHALLPHVSLNFLPPYTFSILSK